MLDLTSATPLPAIGISPVELTATLTGMDVLFARPATVDDWAASGMLSQLGDLAAMPGYDPGSVGPVMLTACGRCAHVELHDGALVAVFAGDGSELDPGELGMFEQPMPFGYRFTLTLDTLVLAYRPDQPVVL